MNVAERKLVVKESMLPGAGKGLYTEELIEKGSCIIEYKGTVTTWKNVAHDDGKNAYVFYVNRNHVTDARDHPHELARYVNDAKGIQQVKGINNNAEYVVIKRRIYIYATKNIPAGAEIFVGYGKGYWDTIRGYLKEAAQNSIPATI
jgi:SET domain-containing protein